MSVLDLGRYEGPDSHDNLAGCRKCSAEFALKQDAPLLLAEVKRLRERLTVLEGMHAVCLEIHEDCESCLAAEEKLEALRKSHARLLEKLKWVRITVSDYGRAFGTTPPELAMIDRLDAAIKEAEAL